MIIRIIKRICRYAFFSVMGAAGLFLLLIGWYYITCPVYRFEEPKPFFGDRLYNPYQNMENDAWRKCIFHLHTKSWIGLTNGENTFEEVVDAYRKLHYEVVCISDYMRINREKTDRHPYIFIYEHGYNIKKTHQLALGATKVVWRDYLFPQNLSQKQHIIDLLKKHSQRVAINHPSMRSSYLPEDFKYLSGYDLFEVQNGTHLSETAWDAALSNGHQAWLIANDDAHTVNNPARMQREVTFVNTVEPTVEALLNRLAQGAAFGIHFPRKQQATREEKEREAGTVSFPVSIQVHDDILQVTWQQTMQQIVFIGDNGNVLKTVADTDTAFYPIRPEDSYVRVKLTSHDGLVYYLNPIIRHTGDYPVKQSLSSIDKGRTFFKMFCFGMSALCVVIYCLRRKNRLSLRPKS